MSEWFVILTVTASGQWIAISPEQDGPVLATAATQEEALDQARIISNMTGLPLYNQEEAGE